MKQDQSDAGEPGTEVIRFVRPEGRLALFDVNLQLLDGAIQRAERKRMVLGRSHQLIEGKSHSCQAVEKTAIHHLFYLGRYIMGTVEGDFLVGRVGSRFG